MKEIQLAVKRDEELDRQAKNGINRVLNIFDPISGMAVEHYIGALQLWERRDPTGPITIMLNTPGGSVTDGFALYDQLQRMRRGGAKVTVHGTGLVASMGTIILQAGNERIIDKNSSILIHEIAAGTVGKLSEIEDNTRLYKFLNNRLMGILAERSNLTAQQINRKASRTEWWFGADEALEMGFVDRVE